MGKVSEPISVIKLKFPMLKNRKQPKKAVTIPGIKMPKNDDMNTSFFDFTFIKKSGATVANEINEATIILIPHKKERCSSG